MATALSPVLTKADRNDNVIQCLHPLLLPLRNSLRVRTTIEGTADALDIELFRSLLHQIEISYSIGYSGNPSPELRPLAHRPILKELSQQSPWHIILEIAGVAAPILGGGGRPGLGNYTGRHNAWNGETGSGKDPCRDFEVERRDP